MAWHRWSATDMPAKGAETARGTPRPSNDPLRDMMKEVRIAVLLFVAGCNQFYGLDETRLATPIDGPGCSDGVFVGPMIEAIPNFSMAQPQVRFDLLELWMEGVFPTDRGIYYARRTSPGAAWGPPVLTPWSETGDRSPALSADGLRLMFSSDERTGSRIWEITRASIKDDFIGMPQPAVGTNNRGGEIDLSYDGLTVYFSEADEFFQRSRPDLKSAFGDAIMVAKGVTFPGVSPDGLELFYQDAVNDKVYRMSRTSLVGMFDTPVLLLDTGDDPDMAPNATTLYLHIDNQPAVLVRPCVMK